MPDQIDLDSDDDAILDAVWDSVDKGAIKQKRQN